MARVKLPVELKKAISQLPSREKDKLLFRLIAKDVALVNQLNFELLEKEEGVTKEDRRAVIEEEVTNYLDRYGPQYFSPGYLLLNLRHLSGEISRHVKTTKDKYGDIYLNFLLLNHCFRLFGTRVQQATPEKAYTFNTYVVKRALRLLNQLKKLHEDHLLDFEDAMKELGGHIGDSHTAMKIAIQNGLDVNWLLKGEVPR